MTTKTCAKCKTTKVLAHFAGDPRGSQSLHAYCRACQRSYNASYRATPKGRIAGLLHDAARRRPVTITRGWLLERLERGVCEATGIPFDFAPMCAGRHQNPRAPSLDRKNPDLDYTPENSQVVLFNYNTAKGQMQDADARALILEMANGIS